MMPKLQWSESKETKSKATTLRLVPTLRAGLPDLYRHDSSGEHSSSSPLQSISPDTPLRGRDNQNAIRREFSRSAAFPQVGTLPLHLLLAGILVVLAVGLYSFHGGNLEFARHTEADRTLIAWEMLERQDFLVPHLLGSEILTKPPLYYCFLSLAIYLFGDSSEWVARFPSALAGGLFVGFQFLFLLAVGFSRPWAFFGSLMVATGAAQLIYSGLAEIDMLFGFLSGSVFALGFLSLEKRSVPLTISTYLLLVLSFLAKGPPSLVFYGLGLVTFFCWMAISGVRAKREAPVLRRLLMLHAIGLALGICIILAWASLLASRVGWEILAQQVRVELVGRVFEESTHARSSFFYLLALPQSALPWAIFPVFFLGLLAWKRFRGSASPELIFPSLSPKAKRFLAWNLSLILPALLLLSVSSGKSSRYCFPLYGPMINLSLLSMVLLSRTVWERRIFRFFSWSLLGLTLGLVVFLVWLCLPMAQPQVAKYLHDPLLSKTSVFLLALGFAYSAALASYSLRRNLKATVVFSICCIVVLSKIILTDVVAPLQNKKRTVKPIAQELLQVLPQTEPLYTIELFDRWIPYYLKRLGKPTFRLSPALAQDLSVQKGSALILLNKEEELWRYEKLRNFAPDETQILKEFRKLDSKKSDQSFLLIQAPKSQLHRLKLHQAFPTIPSLPQD